MAEFRGLSALLAFFVIVIFALVVLILVLHIVILLIPIIILIALVAWLFGFFRKKKGKPLFEVYVKKF